MSWTEFEKAQRKATARPDKEALTCPKCGNSWLQMVELNRFETRQVAILQDPIAIYLSGAPVLICHRCSSVVKFNVQASTTADGRLYNEMMEEVAPPEKKEE